MPTLEQTVDKNFDKTVNATTKTVIKSIKIIAVVYLFSKFNCFYLFTVYHRYAL